MGKYKSLGNFFDRIFRNDLNANFDEVDADIKVQKARVDNLITGNPQPDEVMDLRTDTEGTIHGTAWDRFASDETKKTTKFQEIDVQLAEKANIKLPSNKKYGLIAGVIRNDGTGWKLINDGIEGQLGGHKPLNIDSVEYNATAQRIKINYATLGAKKVVSFIAVPDETFARNGLTFGSSVAPDYSEIEIGKPSPIISARVYFDGTVWKVEGKSGDGALAATPWSGTAVRVTHASIPEAYPIVSPYGKTLYRPVIDAVADGQSNIKFVNSAGTVVTTPDTNMDCILYRGTGQMKKVDPVTISDLVYPWSNIWLYGIMEL